MNIRHKYSIYLCIINIHKYNFYVIFLVYRSLIHEYAFGLIGIVIVLCILITFAIWMLLIYKDRYSSTNLINNSLDDKSLNSTNSKDSGTGESPKRSQEQLYNECKSLSLFIKKKICCVNY